MCHRIQEKKGSDQSSSKKKTSKQSTVDSYFDLMKSFEVARSEETKKIKAEQAAIAKESKKNNKLKKKNNGSVVLSSKKPPPSSSSSAMMTVDLSVSGDTKDGAKSSISASVTHEASVSNIAAPPGTPSILQRCEESVSSSSKCKQNLEMAIRSFDKALNANKIVYNDLVECVSSLELTAVMAKSKLEQC